MTLAISHRSSDTGSSPRRPSLYLVPPLHDDLPDEAERPAAPRLIADVRRSASVGRSDAVRRSPAVRRSAPVRRPVRLTKRGRIVVGVVLLGFAIGLMALLAPPTQAASPAPPPRAFVVHSGDTLWSIATSALPREDPLTAVDRVRAFNHLPDNRVYVGEQLLLPAS